MRDRKLATTAIIAAAALIALGTAMFAADTGVSVAALPAVVVATTPRAGDLAVDPGLTEIRVTFSKDMADKSWSWVRIGAESFPEMSGDPRYLSDKRTCVLPVRLKPGRVYAIYLNRDAHANFRDAAGQSAMPYLLTFETRH